MKIIKMNRIFFIKTTTTTNERKKNLCDKHFGRQGKAKNETKRNQSELKIINHRCLLSKKMYPKNSYKVPPPPPLSSSSGKQDIINSVGTSFHFFWILFFIKFNIVIIMKKNENKIQPGLFLGDKQTKIFFFFCIDLMDTNFLFLIPF